MYTPNVPKLWDETIEAHRETVRQATLDVTAGLIAEHGLRSVTMSRIADVSGIGRATLYKYFPDLESILLAWHDRAIHEHLRLLESAREGAASPAGQLPAVLSAYARIVHGSHGRHDAALVAMLHRDQGVAQATRRVRKLMADVLSDAVAAGLVRDDVPTDELAVYCMHAIAGARELNSSASVKRLVEITLAGVRAST
jgi:AcrR family transcriptional regulator